MNDQTSPTDPRLERVEALESLGDAATRAGHPEVARYHLQEAAGLLGAIDFGRYEAARATHLARLHRQLCDLALDLQDIRQAEREAERSVAWARRRVAHDPTNSAAHLQLAMALRWSVMVLRLSNRPMAARVPWREVIESLRKAALLAPGSQDAWRILADEFEQGASTGLMGFSPEAERDLRVEAVAARRQACIVAPTAQSERLRLVGSIGALMDAEQRCGNRAARDRLSLEQQHNLRFLVTRGVVPDGRRSVAEASEALARLANPECRAYAVLRGEREPAATWRFGAPAPTRGSQELARQDARQAASERWDAAETDRQEEESELRDEHQALRSARWVLEARRRSEMARRAEEDEQVDASPKTRKARQSTRLAEDQRYAAAAAEQKADESRHRTRLEDAEVRWMTHLASRVTMLKVQSAQEEHVRRGKPLPKRWIQ